MKALCRVPTGDRLAEHLRATCFQDYGVVTYLPPAVAVARSAHVG